MHGSKRTNEPLVWVPFSAGLGIDALVLPALIVATGLLVPAGLVGEGLQGFAQNILVRIVLWGVASATFFHAAHRLKFVLVETGMRPAKATVGGICYLAAVAGTVWAALVAFGGM